jgi:hypothetical protein
MSQVINISRYVSSLDLEPDDYLLPLHEVVVNAIQSIEDSKNKKSGLINITIIRDSQLTIKNEFEEPYKPILGFEIEDNGIGFIEKRFKAFHEWGTELNVKKGCKGIGRYTVLACFGSMEIISEFKDKDKYYKRKFKFDAINDIVPDGEKSLKPISPTNNKTIVKLNSYLKKYKETIVKKKIGINEIADSIIQHCLLYFLENDAPLIILKEKETEAGKVILNDKFKSVIKTDRSPENINIGKLTDKFTLHYIRNYNNRSHSIHLCANKREVGEKINAANYIPAFVKPLADDTDSKYYLSIYTTGSYLDEKANSQRTKFLFPLKEVDKNSFDKLSFEELFKGLASNIRSKYETSISETEKEKNETIRNYILNKKKPRLIYRHLLDMEEVFEDIPYNPSDEKLEEELHRKTYELEVNRKKAFDRLFKKKKYDKEEFHEIVNKILKEEAQFSYSKLADLLIHRKSIINLFKKYIQWRSERNHWLEEDLHNLIFTMGAESNTMPFDYHNLWLLDERLAFHRYTTSDRQIRTNQHTNSDSQKETDLLIYDFPWAYSDDPNRVNSLVIFEFKRPGRDMLTNKDKELDSQVREYFQNLMESKSTNDKGDFLKIKDATPKFGYIVCSLHEELIEWNVKHNFFKRTPYGTLFKINPELNQYFEVMDYNDMIDFADKRHLAFFKALGINDID